MVTILLGSADGIYGELKLLLLLSRFQSCPTLWPQRWQPTRLPRPWDSPGKNTGVGCHFLLHCMNGREKWKLSRSVVSDSSRPHGLQPTRLLRPWDFPGKSTGVGCHFLLLREGKKQWYSLLYSVLPLKLSGSYQASQSKIETLLGIFSY